MVADRGVVDAAAEASRAMAAASTAEVCEVETTEGAEAGEKETVKDAVFQEEETVMACPTGAEKEAAAVCWEAAAADWFRSLGCTRKLSRPCR